MKISYSKIAWVVLLIVVLLSACKPDEENIEQLSDSYKQNRDYESLVALITHLNYTLTRSNVENLLGEGMLCPVLNSCTYFSDKMVVVNCQSGANLENNLCQRFPLALVVRYDLIDEKTESPQDVLSGFWLGPVGE